MGAGREPSRPLLPLPTWAAFVPAGGTPDPKRRRDLRSCSCSQETRPLLRGRLLPPWHRGQPWSRCVPWGRAVPPPLGPAATLCRGLALIPYSLHGHVQAASSQPHISLASRPRKYARLFRSAPAPRRGGCSEPVWESGSPQCPGQGAGCCPLPGPCPFWGFWGPAGAWLAPRSALGLLDNAGRGRGARWRCFSRQG